MLADDLTERFKDQRSFSEDTIRRIESGESVDPCSLAPVLIALGLAREPSLDGPQPGQSAGEWVRALRQAAGISREALSGHAEAQAGQQKQRHARLSARALGRIESGQTRPTRLGRRMIANAFNHYGIMVQEDALNAAWGTPSLSERFRNTVAAASGVSAASAQQLSTRQKAAALGSLVLAGTAVGVRRKARVGR